MKRTNPQRIIIEVDEETRRLLKVYAARNGLTMKESIRRIAVQVSENEKVTRPPQAEK